jgi:hypothetical protein
MQSKSGPIGGRGLPAFVCTGRFDFALTTWSVNPPVESAVLLVTKRLTITEKRYRRVSSDGNGRCERTTRQSKARQVPKSATASFEQTPADLRPNEKLKLEQRIASLESSRDLFSSG